MSRTVSLPPRQFLEDLVLANRYLAKRGILDGFGHVSARHPDVPDVYVMSRSLAPEAVSVEDLQLMTLGGGLLNGDDRHPYRERPLHGMIYEARPDVMAVCHTHVPSVIPFTVTGTPMRAVYHMGSLIGREVPMWDSASEWGATDMLVADLGMGRSLAAGLGGHKVVLMRGHGATVTGKSIAEMIMTANYMDINAGIQLQAMQTGAVRYLSPEEIDLASRTITAPGAMAKALEAMRATLDDR